MSPGFTAFVIFIKYAIFCVRAEEIFEIMDDLEELNEEYKHLPKASEIISKANKLTLKVTTPLKWGCIFTVILYILKPLVTDFISYFYLGIEPSRELILKGKFPYDASQSPAYQLTFLYQTYSTILVGMIVYVMSLNFTTFTLNIAAHLQILRDSINDLKIDEFVKYHMKIISITKRLNSIYSPMIFTQFFIETTLFVGLGLCIVSADNWIEKVKPILHVFGAVVDVACHSFGSQQIMDSSEAICDEAHKIDKDYIMVIMTAQKKFRITTAFFDASFETYSFMLSRTWSLISLFNEFS
ncbi:odorant receptor 82a-like [Chironomus tepperi]|uniref:odorant receptor 82a-like n=1 Tax=Chironomus tepperi TaxID=113505 RepID=UPI00391EE671